MVLEENNLEENIAFIENADESGFQLDPKRLKGIGVKGVPLHRISGGSGRTQISVLGCVAADGSKLPPLIIYKGAAVQVRWFSDNDFPGTLYAASENGWMEEPVFWHWMTNGFVPYVKNLGNKLSKPDQPALLLYDGHSSHYSVRILELAIENNIILMRFPSHLTDEIQPLDKCVFGPVKTAWDKLLVANGTKAMKNGLCQRLPKDQFAVIIIA